jgi:glycosyltransferase involved in cell wall biosynthesis
MAEFDKGQLGGGESVVLGLVRGLVELGSTTETYIVVTSQSMAASIREFLVPPHEVICRPASNVGFLKTFMKSICAPYPKFGAALRKLIGRKPQGLPRDVPALDRFVIALAPDVIHYLYPLHFALGHIPTVYTVHDQNYEHLPNLFEEGYIRWRRALMTAATKKANAIVAISQWVAGDVCRIYPQARDKIHVVKWAPYVSNVRKGVTEYVESLPQKFVLYPAVTYSHKNHLNLIKALSYLNQHKASDIGLVLTGAKNEYWKVIEREVKAVADSLSVTHLGYVSESLLANLYDKAALIVFPSFFEGAGLPLLEAISIGKRVCCSDIPPFREFGGDYPRYFDPNDITSIAAAVHEMLGSTEMPKIAPPQSTWGSVARAHQAIYRNVIEQQLSKGWSNRR